MIETSGHDRLRAAADLLDGSAEEFTAVTTQSKATADLLRAVAVTQETYGYRTINATFHGTTYLPGFVLARWRKEAALLRAMDNDAKAVFDAGLALADAILGGTE